MFLVGSARIHGRSEKSRGRKRANKPHDIMCPRRRRDASLSRRVPKPVDFPFERFPESDDISERNGRLAGWLTSWPVSKSRTRGTLASAVTVRYTISRRVFRAYVAKSFSRWKNQELAVNAIGETAILREKEIELRNFLDNCRESFVYIIDVFMYRWICRISTLIDKNDRKFASFKLFLRFF